MGSFLLLVTMGTCEQKNKALKTAVFNLAKRSKVDCNDCYNDILAAATECILSFDWKNCIEDILGGGSDCIECVCQVIGDIGNILDKTGVVKSYLEFGNKRFE